MRFRPVTSVTVAEALQVVAAAGAGVTLDLVGYSTFDVTGSAASCLVTPVVSAPAAGRAYAATILLRQDSSGNRAWTFPASVKWAVPPVFSKAANAVDTVSMMTTDGGVTFLAFGPGGSINAALGSTWSPNIASSFSSVLVANQLYLHTVNILEPGLITGVEWHNDTPIGSSAIAAMFDASGAQVGVTASTAQSSAFATQPVPFTTPYVAPIGTYQLAIVPNNATGHFVVGRLSQPNTNRAQGAYSMPGSITPLSAADRIGNSPILGTY